MSETHFSHFHYALNPDHAPLLFACCVWVPGTARSLVYDLQLERGLSLPGPYNDLMRLLEQQRGKPLKALLSQLEEPEQGRLLGLLQFLIDQDLLFLTATPERFPPLSLRWSHPSEILSAILDVDEASDHALEPLVEALETLGCERLVVRLTCREPMRWIDALLRLLSPGSGMSLELFLNLEVVKEVQILRDLCAREARIATVHAMGAEEDEIIQHAPSGFGTVQLHRAPPVLERCEAPGPADQHISLELFCESQTFNPFTHRKVCISAGGLIQNTVGKAPSFGDIHRDALLDVVRRADFQAAWFIHKGQIRGCRDCELRHLCVDPRLPVPTGEGDFEHTSLCRYDPLKGEWRE